MVLKECIWSAWKNIWDKMYEHTDSRFLRVIFGQRCVNLYDAFVELSYKY